MLSNNKTRWTLLCNANQRLAALIRDGTITPDNYNNVAHMQRVYNDSDNHELCDHEFKKFMQKVPGRVHKVLGTQQIMSKCLSSLVLFLLLLIHLTLLLL